MELAWLYRSRLTAQVATPHLLQNLAGTLAYCELAVGLCFSLLNQRMRSGSTRRPLNQKVELRLNIGIVCGLLRRLAFSYTFRTLLGT